MLIRRLTGLGYGSSRRTFLHFAEIKLRVLGDRVRRQRCLRNVETFQHRVGSPIPSRQRRKSELGFEQLQRRC